MTPAPQVVVVGAGMAGLRCALELQGRGLETLVLEAGDAAGGRVRTDEIDGFLVDRGFQVLLTAYPEARSTFDYGELDLMPFVPGALCRRNGGFASIADPLRNPMEAAAGLLSPVGSPGDIARLVRLWRTVRRDSLQAVFRRPETTTAARLDELGFSAQVQDAFWRPFLRGIFLDPELETSSRLFEFVVRMFTTGDTAVPAHGMGRLADQLAARLQPGSLRLGARVTGVEPRAVILADGERIAADAVVVATTGLVPEVEPAGWHSVTTYAFDAPEPPVRKPVLVLDGTGGGPVSNLHVASAVSAATAPAGRSLVSATVVGLAPDGTEAAVRRQLTGWYGSQVAGWRLLQELRLPHALPVVAPRLRSPRLPSGLYACGDHLIGPTLNAALASGRRAGAAVSADLAR
jgi:glycine/D-amino acid oxidase-like deaminating enzyme